MNNKTNPVDVLAVMDWLVDKLPYEGEESADRFNEARAAIAELIEAAHAGTRNDRPIGFTLNFNEHQSERLAAALARVGGAA